MKTYLCSSLNAAPLSVAGQTILAALRVQYLQRADRCRAISCGRGFRLSEQNNLFTEKTNSHTDRPESSQCFSLKESGNQNSQDPKPSQDLNLNRLDFSKRFEPKGVLSDEKIEMYHAAFDDVVHPNTQSIEPVAQGEVLSPVSGIFFERITQGYQALTESKGQMLTLSKRRWILPEKILECDNPHEAPPMKKCCFEQLSLPMDNCNKASREKLKVDKQTKNKKINPFCSHQSYSGENGFMNKELLERGNIDPHFGVISETKCDQAVFIQTQAGLLSNAVKPKSRLPGLETSLFPQDRRHSKSSASEESCLYFQRCESSTVHECDQNTSVKPDELLDLSKQKEDSGSERTPILKGRTNFLQPDDIALPMLFGEKNCVMESTLPITLEGAQPSIQSLTQEAHKTTLSPEKSSRTQRNWSLTTSPASSKVQLSHKAAVKTGSVQPLKRTKVPRCEVQRPRHRFRPQRESSQEWKESNLSEAPRPSVASHIGSNTLPSETDRNEELTTATSKGGFSLTSDPRVCDTGRLSEEERGRVCEEAGRARALVVTMVYQDGTIQLDPEQRSCPAVCGLLVLLKGDLDSESLEERPQEKVLYLRLEQTPTWAQQDLEHNQKTITRELLLQMVCGRKPIVCFKAKDLLRTALRHFSKDLSWKQVLGCQIMDPQIAAWLLDPADPASCFQTLVYKHYIHPVTRTSLQPVLVQAKVTQVISNLSLLHGLMDELHNKLQTQGLWQLYSGIEQMMIPVLAAMESYTIHVDKEALKKTSEMLGSKLKQLEQEAHQAAGQQFLVSSSAQLRLILFEKLRLHEQCENKKLPKTIKQQQSTSETALLQLQNLHPLPNIILQYRQIHKIKTAFVDGILSCTNKTFISSTWNQTSTVSGRLSAKHPNFQALPKHPLQILKKQYVHGKNSEVVSVHPRAMFIPREGWTFLSADFCQVELRLLAHLSSDPQLLGIFQRPEADAFTMLAAQWKGVSEDKVSLEDREHSKRIVYSLVYGAGRERLSGILGVSAEEASRFQDSFLQTYREVQAFIQHTIQHCHKQGFVKSIMGRRRCLPHIHSADWSLRNQAERQAVNFVLQGSAADLAKMAMIKICSQVSSTSYTARLVAQIHDELLFEVEFAQVNEFAVLVKKTMESLQHIESLGVSLSVPLKVSLSTGQTWGSMCEMNLV
ncbi:DNA polymerase nu-like isoform X2 [Triplophysa dalaica]|uniref:DNA polymerase nu-like isoform X2 n=1 Tax=Triplophysa dalaica TaxID=1582913 RepID=UPI0024E024F4|nr:DNA polymerase nu-like isoform X2 [Triplophysa dalaica]